MNPAVLVIRYPLFAVLAILITVVAGWLAYGNMARFEDPEFSIRTARIVTSYPGASPLEVLEEVTEPLEAAIQQLAEVESLESQSAPGLSTITVDIHYWASRDREALDVVWSKLRNKVGDAAPSLPPGAGAPIVRDDLGDVYGIYYLLTGPDFSMREIESYAESLQRDLLLVDGVARVDLIGQHEEAIFVEVAREQAASLGVSLSEIYQVLGQQNTVAPAGDMVLDGDKLDIHLTGDVVSVDAISNMIVRSSASDNLTRLGAIARVYRGEREPVAKYVRYDGEPAIGLGISALPGLNVVELGEAVEARLGELESARPAGMLLHEFYHQGKIVDAAIGDFAWNVIAALCIVFVTLLIFMGLRSGLVMGLTVLLTMAATLAVMWIAGIPMHRISLGALVISLGMLVDNGVVITDDMLVGIRRGASKIDAARRAASKNFKPLLGGTLVGIIAFAPIGFAPGSTAEFTNSLFWVVLISLSFSWLFAFTLTPLFCYWLFPAVQAVPAGEPAPPRRESAAVRGYKAAIDGALRLRWLVLLAALGAFVASIVGFGAVQPGFFPASTSPQVVVDFSLPEGADIGETRRQMLKLEAFASGLEGVEAVHTLVGGPTLRYMLVYQATMNGPEKGQLLIRTDDYRNNDRIVEQMQNFADREMPEGQAKAWKFQLGPGGGAKIEAVFSGPDPEVLRGLAAEARAIMAGDPDAVLIRDDWGRKVPVIQPLYSENKGERVGVTRQAAADAMEEALNGRQRGVFREGADLIPIISRAPLKDFSAAQDLANIPVLSATTRSAVPLAQVVDGVEVIWRDGRIIRQNRVPTITAQSDPRLGVLPAELLGRLQGPIEAIPLPPGYSLTWEGELGESSEARSNLASTIPLGLLAMVLVVIALFNRLRQPLIIFSVVPLALVGVIPGLILTGTPLEFMGLLGLLSLSGLLIQNSLVLVDSSDNLIARGMPRHDALVESAASRLRPVLMGSFTTVLGVMPLYFDAFFQSMTVVIAAGLTFATLITLLVTPAFYAVLFRIGAGERGLPQTAEA